MKFIVGIDLGTTNSVVSTVEAEAEDGEIRLFEIPQLTSATAVEARAALPSFLYLPPPAEVGGDNLRLPWAKNRDYAVGLYAQARGAEVPDRVVSSAKSWLSHSGADRTGAVLPWQSPDDVPKLSPVEVTSRYLSHVREAWDAAHSDAPLSEQEVLVTVPASFDEVARELTLRAAREAGLPDVTLLEEPQAAFYAWIDTAGEAWREQVEVGDRILVCDVGGGTTDLSLIAVGESDGSLELERIAVGDHILLGGDNMDLALAYRVSNRLAEKGTKLDPWQFRGLIQNCRAAKEKLLDDSGGADSVAVSILGRGRKLVGGTLRFDITRADLEESLVDGFFPAVDLGEPLAAQQRTGLQELGLPYASDPAVTRHIAHFLRKHAGEVAAAAPTAMLFNGGVMNAAVLRNRTLEVVGAWGNDVRNLQGADPHYAVARGAVYYGLARRGRGVRIRGGTAHSFYIGIETAMPAVPGMRPPIKALCVVPQGLEEGTDVALPAREFGLAVGQPVEFRFLSSSSRREDDVGLVLDSWDDEEITELAPVATTLEWEGHEGATVPIHLEARVSELGILELWCVSRDDEQRWKLELNVRAEKAG
jgi:molecular chaperone DnaK (HSP70)